jgi:RNA polymerase sigma-70 factor (ECF subfamily)
MGEPVFHLPEVLERYRSYLRLLARLHWREDLRGRLDPSDLVQQTMVQALQAQAQFRGQDGREVAAWLRQILIRTLLNAVRHQGRARRDAGRERSLQAAVEQSSARLEAWLAAEQTSPSELAERHEHLLRLAQALENLPEAQREAITLHHLQDWTLEQVGVQLGRSPAAVAGLIKRGLQHLRSVMDGGTQTK